MAEGAALPAPLRCGEMPGECEMLPRDLRSALNLLASPFVGRVLPAELLAGISAQRLREIEFVENALDRDAAENDLYFQYI